MFNKKTIATMAVLAMLALVAVPAAAQDLWFHVTVNESGGDNANVTVNLPISIVDAALPMIPEDQLRDGKIVIDEAEFNAANLRQLWNEVRNSPDMTFVTVQADDANVRVYKDGDYLMAVVDEHDDGAQVNARIPLAVVDALLSGAEDELDIRAALEALVAHGPGELVTVNDDETQVRVWIDYNPEAS